MRARKPAVTTCSAKVTAAAIVGLARVKAATTAMRMAAAVGSPAVRVTTAAMRSVSAVRRGRGTRCANDNASCNQEHTFQEVRFPHLIPPSTQEQASASRHFSVRCFRRAALRAVVIGEHVDLRRDRCDNLLNATALPFSRDSSP